MSSFRLHALMFAVGLWGPLGCGCQAKGPEADPKLPASAKPSSSSSPVQPDWSRLSSDAKLAITALRMPHRQLRRALGAHKVSARAKLATEGRQVEVEVRVEVDAKGRFRARKHLGRPHGQQVVWTGDWLYSRHRDSRYIKRRPRSGEPARRLERIYGLLPAYVELLGPWLRVESKGRGHVHGREVVKLAFGVGRGKPSASEAPARRWRQTIEVTKLEGQALLDARTGAPLSVDLEVSYRFAPPAGARAASGIPKVDRRPARQMATLSLRQRVEPGNIKPVTPPAEEQVLADPRRLRLERERQFVTGERPLPDEWPRIVPLAEPGRKRR